MRLNAYILDKITQKAIISNYKFRMGSQQQETEQKEEVILVEAKTFFQLIEKVGSKGKYQRNIFFIFALNWFIGSLLLLGTSFLFLNPKLDCEKQGVQTADCEAYVCSLPENQRASFYADQDVVSLATEFGPFHCNKILELDALRMTLYIGTFFGYICILFITDNFGRKLSILLAWGLTLAGVAFLCISVNIQMACIGLFLAGFGCESGIRISMAVLGQVVEYTLRQKYSVALQIAFGLGGMTIGLFYFIFKEWRWITIFFCLIPAIIQMFLLIFYLQQTPKYAIKKNKQKALKGLNRIGKINLGQSHVISQQDIDRVIENQVKDTKLRTPLDLCIYKSQRTNFIASSVVFFCITYLYFGPVVIVDDLGLDVYVSQVILGASEVAAYPISYLFIQKSPRKKSGYIFFTISALLFGILIFVQPSEDCNGCAEAVFQLILVFGARFCISYYFSIFFLYATEIFPLPLRGLGFGMGSAIAALASSSSQFVLTAFEQVHINPMIMFTTLAILSIFATTFLPETLNKPLAQNIPEQLQHQKEEKASKSGQISSEREQANDMQIEMGGGFD